MENRAFDLVREKLPQVFGIVNPDDIRRSVKTNQNLEEPVEQDWVDQLNQERLDEYLDQLLKRKQEIQRERASLQWIDDIGLSGPGVRPDGGDGLIRSSGEMRFETKEDRDSLNPLRRYGFVR